MIAVAKYQAILCDNEALLKSYVEKAVALTHSMLTRLPPLLVCKILLYHEDYYDTNQLTWDETKKTGTCMFYCYRPVVFFGNKKHIAVKGLLGNTEEEIKDDVLPQKSCELQVKSLFQDESQSLKVSVCITGIGVGKGGAGELKLPNFKSGGAKPPLICTQDYVHNNL